MKKSLYTKLVIIVLIASMINVGLLFGVSADTVKTLTLEEDWRLIRPMDIDAGEGNIIVLDGRNKYTIYEMNTEAVLTNSTGTVRLKDLAVINAGTVPAAGSLAELYIAAKSVTSVAAPAPDATSLTMPAVTGFTVSIHSSSKPGIIGLDGTITPPASPQTVELVFTVSGNGGEADTAGITVTVPAGSGSGPEQTPSLGGNISITGTAKFGQVLSVNLTNLTNNTGTLSYSWKRGATEVGTSSTYTVVQADIGQSITVTVTGDGTNAAGSITSPSVSPVKGDGPSAPAAPTLASKTTTSITLNTINGAEYSKDNGTTWQDSTVFEGLSSGTAYSFIARIKETATHFASANSTSSSITTNTVTGGNGNGNPDPEPVQSETPEDTTSIDESGKIEVTPVVNPDSKQAVITISSDDFGKAAEKAAAGADGIKLIKLDVKKAEGVDNYVTELPAEVLSSAETTHKIQISTEVGTLVIPSNMLSTEDSAGAENISISIGLADTAAIDAEIMNQIGDRPVMELKLQINGETKQWSNPDAAVSVSVPYTPTAEELADPEHIVVWYLDGSGNVVSVPTGRYDPVSGTVTFSTSHFSMYAIAYVNKSFNDISGYAWAKKAIEVMASKGVIKGTSDTAYSPGAPIKRGDFILMLVRALGLGAKTEDNFADIKPDAYYAEAVAIAKKLGITTGVGNNRFQPEAYISRQDMMTLANRAIKIAGKELPAGNSSDLSMYTDNSSISSYALDSISTLVKNGLIAGSGNKINPLDNTTRAEIAVFIYRIYNK